eukprot:11781891-Ditylum_brightwellii.AAC.1
MLQTFETVEKQQLRRLEQRRRLAEMEFYANIHIPPTIAASGKNTISSSFWAGEKNCKITCLNKLKNSNSMHWIRLLLGTLMIMLLVASLVMLLIRDKESITISNSTGSEALKGTTLSLVSKNLTPIPQAVFPRSGVAGESIEQQYEIFKSLIVQFGPTTLSDLASNDTAQHCALFWLIYHDGARINTKDEDHPDALNRRLQRILERYALAVLYFSTNDINMINCHDEFPSKWTENKGWMEPSLPICSWHGVNCHINLPSANIKEGTTQMLESSSTNIFDEVVSSLRMEYNGLDGIIPSELKLLKHLSELNLTHNALRGDLPTEIVDLRGLCELLCE